ncbi:MAG: replication-associated recombination protein A [Chloroflexi bacterium]|nr:replication-associated recombination protein A [Chloroflexota bacterium]
MDLFEYSRQQQLQKDAPLAYRMRPRTFDEFIGQEHIVGEKKLLRRMIEADRLTSIILWGPPGSGKTTLANIIAEKTASHFETINAVLDGVARLREVINDANERRRLYSKQTILFIDEIHRWNKSQQDALLPRVEAGEITLIGATTENPYFEIISPLLSRSRVFELQPLAADDVKQVLKRALKDSERGLGDQQVHLQEDALTHLARIADGDARDALNALELAVLSTAATADGKIVIDLEVAQESIQRRAVRYDKDGDEHHDTISAFIKSVRGSDPDAALFWLAKMVQAGEDHRFIMRRLLILASEDVGMANPRGIMVASGLAQALEYVGMPEGLYFLAHATIYLAASPKSNSVGAIFSAIRDIEKGVNTEVPAHLRNSPRQRDADHHAYKYPHDFPAHFVKQQYLPNGLTDKRWYEPTEQGAEASVRDWLTKLHQPNNREEPPH